MSLITQQFVRKCDHTHHVTKSVYPLSIIHKKISEAVGKDFKALTDEYEPKVADAFVKVCKEIRKSIDMKKLVKACENHNWHKAVELVSMDKFAKALNGEFKQHLFEAYHAGAMLGAKQLARGRIKKAAGLATSLNITNQSAVNYLASALPELIKEINKEQQQTVQTILLDGINEGHTGDEIARDIRNSVGLTSVQAQWVDNFRTQLETGEVGGFTPIDERRLSATDTQMAMDEFEDPNTNPDVVDLLVDKYQFSLINKRAMDISVTEIHDASIAGQDDLWQSAVDLGYLDPNTVSRYWGGTDDGRERESHLQVPIDNPDGVGLDEDFDTEVGPVHAPGQSGDASFDINCRCYVYLVFDNSADYGDTGGVIGNEEEM